ncbi:DUF3173 domain-containing protein [uncultured Vagococcus sp.]|uniref:DUF3173 domain-containing protein n=1 Tax=uncultured Vagococcus sp. TaxID=189676 RepID=UPI0025886504|nr:DUF3173 domain-containing protein [uncultured Vagococcus sp.]
MTITKEDLMNAGYKENTARTIIRQAKDIMIQRGYPLYENKRLGRVPIGVVEEIIGCSLDGVSNNG